MDEKVVYSTMHKLLQWEDSNFYMAGIHVLLEMHRKLSTKSKTKLEKKKCLDQGCNGVLGTFYA